MASTGTRASRGIEKTKAYTRRQSRKTNEARKGRTGPHITNPGKMTPSGRKSRLQEQKKKKINKKKKKKKTAELW